MRISMTLNKSLDQLKEIGTIRNLHDREDSPTFNGYYIDPLVSFPAVYYYDKLNDELKLVPFIQGEKYFKVRLRDNTGKEYVIGYNFIIANMYYYGGKKALEHPENYMNFPLFSQDETKFGQFDFFQWQPIPKNFGVAEIHKYDKTEKYREHISEAAKIYPEHPDIGYKPPVPVKEDQTVYSQDSEWSTSWETVPQDKKDWLKVAIRNGWIKRPNEFAYGLKHSKNLLTFLERQVREENEGVVV